MMLMTNSASLRPLVTLKLATSLDGKIATVSGASKWITGLEARQRVHQMRSQHDCVLTGIGTVLADDPELTARTDPAPTRQPVRAILDSAARLPLAARLLATSHLGPICAFHDHDYAGPQTPAARHKVYRGPDGLDLADVLATLVADYQAKSVMIEAGSKVAGSFLRAGLVDEIVWFRAPIIIGGDGLSVFGDLGVNALSDALAFACTDIGRVGRDSVETYRRTFNN
jgi:diaminohydroxyphosphoribosylaminopyrimidine deaminase / 5-amino-6-(5-phosphoribosylamino)uracil reductase